MKEIHPEMPQWKQEYMATSHKVHFNLKWIHSNIFVLKKYIFYLGEIRFYLEEIHFYLEEINFHLGEIHQILSSGHSRRDSFANVCRFYFSSKYVCTLYHQDDKSVCSIKISVTNQTNFWIQFGGDDYFSWKSKSKLFIRKPNNLSSICWHF